MKKLRKVKAIIAGIFNNIPAYTEMTLQAMGMTADSLKSFGMRMNRSEQEQFNDFMTNYVKALEKSVKAHKKELVRVLTRELKKLTFEQLDFVETAVDPEMLKSVSAVNMAIVPTVMKISVGAINESGIMDFAGLGGIPATPKRRRRAIVRRSPGSRKGVKIKAAKRANWL